MTRGASGSWQFWLLTAAAASVVVLVLVNNSLLHGNRDLQAELAKRQQTINQSAVLGRLGDQLVRALATQAAQTNDSQIRDLLAGHGITFTVQAPPAAQGGASPAGNPPAPAAAVGGQ
jgi:hypothetical protein